MSKEKLFTKTLFLLGLALGNRASELHSILRSQRFIIFARHKHSVKILPNPSFLTKNEAPGFRRKPMIIKALLKRDGSHHPLCPVNTLSLYLHATRSYNGTHLFFNPSSGVQCNAGHINYFVRKLIRLSQPGVYARFHDLCKFAAWNAFWNGMKWRDIRIRGFWRTNSVLARQYLANATPSHVPCVALGEVCNT